LHSAVGRDLLKNAKARFDAFHVLRILRGLFGRLVGEKLAHLFLVLKPALESAHPDTAENRDSDDDYEEYEKGRFQVTLPD
jgi:hypothetical protein